MEIELLQEVIVLKLQGVHKHLTFQSNGKCFTGHVMKA